MSEAAFVSAKSSRTTITELMIPSYTNFGVKIHGGVILSLMDKAAYVCACKHARAYCVTASIDTVDFLQSVEVGELVSLKANVNYVGNSSMIVGIRVESENVKTNISKHTNTSYFTMVAKDDNNNLVMVPALMLETPDDIRHFKEVIMRKQLKLAYKQEILKMKGEIDIQKAIRQLENERFMISLQPL